MNCPAFEMLSAGADGALAAHELHSVQGHLAGCARCRALRAELVLLKASVREGAEAPPASEALKVRLATIVARRRSFRRAATVSAAMVGAVAAVVILTRRAPPDLAAQLVGDHVLMTLEGAKPLEVRDDDPSRIERWFEGRLDFALRIPRLPDARIVGGRVCSIAGRRAALAFYERNGRRLSLFMMYGASARSSGCEGVQGFSVCQVPLRGVGYALVTELPAAQTQWLLREGLEQLE